MTPLMKAVLAFLAIACLLTIVLAEDSDQAILIKNGRRLSDSETMYYLQMATKYSRYSIPPKERPPLFVVPERAFVDVFCGKDTAPDECDLWGVTDSLPPFAVYARDRDPHNPHTVADTLVHETVHWLQMHSNFWPWDTDDCASRAAHEAEAYSAAYVFAVQEEKLDAPFETAPTWMLCKMTHSERGHH